MLGFAEDALAAGTSSKTLNLSSAIANAFSRTRIYSVLCASAIANGLFFNHRPLDPAKIRKVLVVQTRDLGDVVLATALLEPLRRRFPNARIVMVIGEWAQDLVATSPLVDGVVTYCSVHASNADPKKHRFRGRVGSIRRMIEEDPDLILELRGDVGTLAAALFSSARHRADRGTWRLRDLARNLVARRKLRLSHDIHEIEISWDIAASLGVTAPNRRMRLSAGADDIRAVEELLETGRLRRKRLVVLHPGASKEDKMWPAERFGALANLIGDRDRVQLVVTGSEKERQLAEAVAKSSKYPILDLCGRLSLRQLHVFYARCALWIGNDTGPMHIAAAAGIPVVALWGPMSTPKYYPFTPRRLIIARPSTGAAARSARCDDITRITVQHAWHQLKEFLDDQRILLEPVEPA